MQIFLFFALFISVIAVVFAIQNTATTTISFIFWKLNGSLALILLISLAAGALISFFASLPSNIKIRWTARQQRKKLNELEASLAIKEQDLETLQSKLEQLQRFEGSPEQGETKVTEFKETKKSDEK